MRSDDLDVLEVAGHFWAMTRVCYRWIWSRRALGHFRATLGNSFWCVYSSTRWRPRTCGSCQASTSHPNLDLLQHVLLSLLFSFLVNCWFRFAVHVSFRFVRKDWIGVSKPRRFFRKFGRLWMAFSSFFLSFRFFTAPPRTFERVFGLTWTSPEAGPLNILTLH